MKVGVVGVGAIGGWIAARLARAGHAVSCLARADTLTRLRERGLTLESPHETFTVPVIASSQAADLGVQDLVIVAVKAPALGTVASQFTALLGADTLVLPLMNGVPWWYMAQSDPQPLASVDPEGALAAAFPAERVIGAVVHAACRCPQPAHIVETRADTLMIGEPSGGESARVTRLVATLVEAGLPATVRTDIRNDIWYKLWGNMTMNPVSALSRATCDRLLDDPDVSDFVLRIMAEAAEVGAAIGCPIAESGADRNAVTRKLGAFKTSMLQDVEAGRPLEHEALLGAPREIARRTGIATPNMDALYGLTRVLADSLDLARETR